MKTRKKYIQDLQILEVINVVPNCNQKRIMDISGISHQVVKSRLDALESKGYVKSNVELKNRKPGRNVIYELTESGELLLIYLITIRNTK